MYVVLRKHFVFNKRRRATFGSREQLMFMQRELNWKIHP